MEDTGKVPSNHRSKLLGGIGMLVGLFALSVAVASPYLVEYLDPPKATEDTVAELAVKIREKVKDAIIKGKVEKTEVKREPMTASIYIPIIALGLGIAGISLGAIGLLRNEDRFVAGTSIALGGSAIVAQYAILLTGALILAIIVAAVLSQLDIL